MIKLMMSLNKTAFDNTFNTLTLMQDQTERIVNTFIDQATWFPKEGKRVVDEWTNSYKRGRDNYKASLDESFKRVDDFFSSMQRRETAL